jgi:dsDNA-binding SOS-regulon protein
VLTDQQLAHYALWCKSLSKAEADQWEKILATCKADKEWQETIRSFQFDEKVPAKELLAGSVKSLLIEEEED